jgi:hypothetical protein
MLSAVILYRHSYPAVLLAEQLVHQRSAHPGPLVLRMNLLKNRRLQQIGANLSHACYHLLLSALDYTFLAVSHFVRHVIFNF